MAISKPTARGEWLARHIPQIDERACRFTSRATWDYNCVGFVVGDYRWWQPDDVDEFHWPANVPRNYWASTYVLALTTVGFEECADAQVEEGFEKVAVFHRDEVFTHVAMIISADVWAAKLGELEDLEHPALGDTLGDYGSVFAYLRRRISTPRGLLPAEYVL